MAGGPSREPTAHEDRRIGADVGDLTATTFGLGYLASAFVFAAVIAIPAIGYRWWGWNSIFCFWFAYVATRPLGASVADWLSKPKSARGLGLGDGLVALALTLIIFVLVAYLAITHRDVQAVQPPLVGADEARASVITDVQ